jgi:hypothetical protein
MPTMSVLTVASVNLVGATISDHLIVGHVAQLPDQVADGLVRVPNETLATGLAAVVVNLVQRVVQITRGRTGGNTEPIPKGDAADQLR